MLLMLIRFELPTENMSDILRDSYPDILKKVLHM